MTDDMRAWAAAQYTTPQPPQRDTDEIAAARQRAMQLWPDKAALLATARGEIVMKWNWEQGGFVRCIDFTVELKGEA